MMLSSGGETYGITDLRLALEIVEENVMVGRSGSHRDEE